jgi:plastocyanin
MTHPWHTFFNWRLVILAAAICQTTWCATVSGNIEVSLSTKGSHAREESFSDIVVWLEPVQPATALTVQQPQHAQLLQKDKMFHPHTLVITAGSTVDFPNSDPIFHNAFSTFDGQIFDVGLYPPGTTQSVHFRRPGIVRVFCNIHPSMSAIIVVVDTPYFTRTTADGRYQLLNVPPGVYQVHVFDERATTGPDAQTLVTVGEGQETPVSAIRLSETGYVHLPHKNKYGLDYPPSSTDTEIYTGPPK